MPHDAELALADGTSIRLELAPAPDPTRADELPGTAPAEGFWGRTAPETAGAHGGGRAAAEAVAALHTVLRPLGPLLQEVHDAVTAAERPPDEVSVQFGVQVGQDLKLGVVAGSGRASLTITATWRPQPTA
ncbi:CU044_2847 family protein [Streptomyces lunalinharesii]|uniref:Trypsin-co-occurring domain-containing protein n=1 Tax=Streptomyces lunalinharesii TaxID=333384 RepID=A0ABN3SBD3_9ACTN